MVPKLTIVVTCTDSKTVSPEPHLRVRDLPSGRPSSRTQEWVRRVRDARPVARLDRLYKGDQWRRSLAIADAAVEVGFEPQLLVASAGLGLRPIQFEGPSYSATFAPAHEDSVAGTSKAASDWWASLHEGRPSLADEDGRLMLVLSHSYARALADELCQLGQRGEPIAIIGGSDEVGGTVRVPADSKLRRALGGATSSLNARMAAQFLRSCSGPGDWLGELHMRTWNTWAQQNRVIERYLRTPATDKQVRDWIAARRRADPLLSASRALRAFRDAGMACEQARFGQLFRSMSLEESA